MLLNYILKLYGLYLYTPFKILENMRENSKWLIKIMIFLIMNKVRQ